jgi:hypothetical protein
MSEINGIKDDVKVYIRHCDERTVPVLEWFFRGFEVELIKGVKRVFADVLEDMFIKIKEQKQRFALALDGDLIPVVSTDKMVQLFIEPLYKEKRLITLNGERIDKFFTINRAMIGGIKSYKRDRIEIYLKNLDKKQIRPESFLYNKAGYFAQLRTNSPQVGHEYGQFLWHLYEKGFQRGAKATKEVSMRDGDNIEFRVYKQAYCAGMELKKDYLPNAYNKNNLPLEYLRDEKDSITTVNVESEYLKLKEEIDKDVIRDIAGVMNSAVEVGIKYNKWPLLKKIKDKILLMKCL